MIELTRITGATVWMAAQHVTAIEPTESGGASVATDDGRYFYVLQSAAVVAALVAEACQNDSTQKRTT